MDERFRPLYNAAFDADLYAKYLEVLTRRVGPIGFRVAETPVFLPAAFRALCADASSDIVRQLSDPARIERMKEAVPRKYRAAHIDELPQVRDVLRGLVRDPGNVVAIDQQLRDVLGLILEVLHIHRGTDRKASYPAEPGASLLLAVRLLPP